ncbi:MAG: hypothetical protein A2451_02880 [Bdellovibrionales bacterium RIFOXYC2_FULL_39_8]|nr:MAG: hypothetical protein A2451_02880 [Bdellovibrionales bacterium RIFOXYC2_FULL_39_8]
MPPEVILAKSLEQICLSAAGRGKIIYRGNNYTFGYESLLEQKEKNWALAANIPLHGEEVIRLGYTHIEEGRFLISGGIYSSIMDTLERKKEKRSIQAINHYLKNLALFLDFYQQRQDGLLQCLIKYSDEYEVSGRCALGQKGEQNLYWRFKNETLTFSEKEGTIALPILIFSRPQNGIFSGLSGQIGIEGDLLLELNLLTDECFR